MVLFSASCTILQTSIHSSSDTLFTSSNPFNLSLCPLYIHRGFDLCCIWLFKHLIYVSLLYQSLTFAMKSWWSVPVRCGSCFCWLYIAFPSLTTKNAINLISVLAISWCLCIKLPRVVEKWYLLWPMHSLGRMQLAFALIHFVLQGQTCLLLHISLDFLLLHSNPQWWIQHLFSVFVLGGLLGLHRTDQLQWPNQSPNINFPAGIIKIGY